MPVKGGKETSIPGFESVVANSWAVTENGIFWLDVTVSNPPSTICFYDFATRKVKKIGEVLKYVIPGATGFSATRDGKYVLWSQLDRRIRDLMLVEKFR